MEFNTIQTLVTMGNMVLTCGLFFYTRRVAKQEKAEERFKTIEEKLASKVERSTVDEMNAARDSKCGIHKARTSKVEMKTSEMRVELNHLPSQQQFDRLADDIKNLNGTLQNTTGRLDGINRAVDLMNEFLLNKDSKNGGGNEQMAEFIARLLASQREG